MCINIKYATTTKKSVSLETDSRSIVRSLFKFRHVRKCVVRQLKEEEKNITC